MDISKILDIFKLEKKKPNWNYLIVILLLVLAYLILDNFGIGSTKKASAAKQDEKQSTNILATYELEQKNELKYIISKMQGVGNVEVMLYFESGEEQVPATENSSSTSYTEEKDNEGGERSNKQSNDGTSVVMRSDGSNNEPFILRTNKPQLTGVVIIAEGAEDSLIKYDIEKAVSKLYNLDLDKVYVYPMKK